jgi:hypothetical protein
MFEISGTIEDVIKSPGLSTLLTYVNLDATIGQSGSPVMLLDDYKIPKLIAVHSDFIEDISANASTAIDHHLKIWISENCTLRSESSEMEMIFMKSSKPPLEFLKFPTYLQFTNTLGDNAIYDEYLHLKLQESLPLVKELAEQYFPTTSSSKYYETRIYKSDFEDESYYFGEIKTVNGIPHGLGIYISSKRILTYGHFHYDYITTGLVMQTDYTENKCKPSFSNYTHAKEHIRTGIIHGTWKDKFTLTQGNIKGKDKK